MAKAGPISRAIVAMTGVMPRWFVRYISRRYVAGPSLDDAVRVMQRLTDQGACFTVDVLGEEITSMEEATFFLEEYRRVMAQILEHGFDANLSIKPTAFGLLIDEQAGLDNMRSLVSEAAEHDMFVRLDMEDHRVTDATIEAVLTLHAEGLVNVGTVLQGRLHRTLDDIDRMADVLGVAADHRICKGIYLEPEAIAHTSRKDITDATVASVIRSLERGAYVGIASHDDAVINASLAALTERGWAPESDDDPRDPSPPNRTGKGPGYEFQMLLGVRGPLRRGLRQQGHRTRVYIPYGEKWYEYSIRRLKENPTVGTQVAKAFLMPWTNRP
ncbi:MAG: proline dehydrogenase [Candidatus Poseidoniales archaeon]|nr:MAG: proline dehydrogenase [Candidatus Poseidoniales archaeon]